MHFLLESMSTKVENSERVFALFKLAQEAIQDRNDPHLQVMSLVR